MNFPRTTTASDAWLMIALLALIAGAHEYDYQDNQTRLMNHYWYGE